MRKQTTFYDRKKALVKAIDARLKMYECVEKAEMTVRQVQDLTGYANTTCRSYLQEMVKHNAVIVTQEPVPQLGIYAKYKAYSRDALNEYFDKMAKESKQKEIEDTTPFDPAMELKKAISEGRIQCNITTHNESHSKGNGQKMSAWTGYEGMAGF